jgi:serine/threonine-protein kinase
MALPAVLDNYDILERIGAGADSVIYRARERDSGKTVAIKHLVTDRKEGMKPLRHVANEYAVLRALHNENGKGPEGVIRAHRLVKKGGLFSRKKERILVMDYVDGVDLRRENRYPLGQIVDILLQVATSLRALHARGYIHCDVKPENIMVDQSGRATLIDFGFACKQGSVPHSIRGTRDYMAPEQVDRKPLSPQTDIFCFGATMYFLLTGRHVPVMIPAQGDKALFIRNTVKAPSPRSLKPEIPIALDALATRCIARDPIARPASMDEILELLGDVRRRFLA